MAKEFPSKTESSGQQEAQLVRLPGGLSDKIDNVVGGFIADSKNQVSMAHRRFQNADLWIVVKESQLENGGTLHTRVAIGAYKGEERFEPDLVFMPDMTRTDLNGQRFIAPPEARRKMHTVLSTRGYNPDHPDEFLSSVGEKLAESWQGAQAFPQEQVTELLPEYSSSQSQNLINGGPPD